MGGGILGGGGAGGGDWGEDSVGVMTAGWPGAGDGRSRTVGRVGTPGTLGSQWIPPKQESWGKKVLSVHVCGSVCHNSGVL